MSAQTTLFRKKKRIFKIVRELVFRFYIQMSFWLGLVIDTTKLYSLIAFWRTWPLVTILVWESKLYWMLRGGSNPLRHVSQDSEPAHSWLSYSSPWYRFAVSYSRQCGTCAEAFRAVTFMLLCICTPECPLYVAVHLYPRVSPLCCSTTVPQCPLYVAVQLYPRVYPLCCSSPVPHSVPFMLQFNCTPVSPLCCSSTVPQSVPFML